MTLRKLKQVSDADFSLGVADLKKHVSIYTQKQVGQKREGVSAI